MFETVGPYIYIVHVHVCISVRMLCYSHETVHTIRRRSQSSVFTKLPSNLFIVVYLHNSTAAYVFFVPALYIRYHMVYHNHL